MDHIVFDVYLHIVVFVGRYHVEIRGMAVFLTGKEFPGIAADVLFDVVFVGEVSYETESIVMVLGGDVHGAVGDIVLERCMCIGVRAV